MADTADTTGAERAILEDALARLGDIDGRTSTMVQSLIRHLHSFVREVEPTEAEWLTAIRFLTRTGQISDDRRAEFILLSDILGVSMLVDAINHRSETTATESTVLGPFYAGEQPVLPFGASLLKRPEAGSELVMAGHIKASQSSSPISGARIEVWQTAPNGLYDVQDASQPAGHLRGTFISDADGRYRFTTALPVSYSIPDDGPAGDLLAIMKRHPFRPAHVHFMISAPGFRPLVTQLYVAGDPYLASDAVFGVKPSLIVEPTLVDGTQTITFAFTLDPAP